MGASPFPPGRTTRREIIRSVAVQIPHITRVWPNVEYRSRPTVGTAGNFTPRGHSFPTRVTTVAVMEGPGYPPVPPEPVSPFPRVWMLSGNPIHAALSVQTVSHQHKSTSPVCYINRMINRMKSF